MKYLIIVVLSMAFGWLIHEVATETSELLCLYEYENAIELGIETKMGVTCDTPTIRFVDIFGYQLDAWECMMVSHKPIMTSRFCCTIRPWFEQVTGFKRDFWDDADKECKNGK